MIAWDDAPPPAKLKVGPLRAIAAIIRGVLVLFWTVLTVAIYLILKLVEPALGGAKPRYAALRLWSRIMLRLIGLRRIVHGELPPDGTALVANHSTWADIIVFSSIGQVAFVAKSEVAKWPLIGWGAQMMDTMFVERRSSAAERQRIEMVERLERGQQLLFFPEGTSTDGMRVLPFKSALFSAFTNMPDTLIQPVAATYVPAPHLPRAFYGWWGDMSLGENIWALLTHSYGGAVHISFAPPVRAQDFAGRKALALHCGEQVRADWARHSTDSNAAD
ncbi:1-acyl-sn-glycerol-3-phosphate acyltransferase [Monaibacterium marinum]|uniref:1-acyl-sn-glycerol-3-phosphate acyltransferase n=1 Tax=Pontivivens marinum TaxID=1690039 RepID=A0A2C9CUF6_9RHOB|nr:lysophospholipid acyltransferase family protein [Monaibacterium marinum]SOH94029.1 1-acyl-sn-glycerol-3-phosphate acyltransferase [Monaibacterium marinum]